MNFEDLDFSKIHELQDEFFLDGRNCMKTVAYLLEGIYPKSKFEEIAQVLGSHGVDPYITSDIIRVNELYKEVWRNNVRVIFNNAESPILTTFLHALNIFSIATRFSQLVFIEPSRSMSQEMRAYRESYEVYLTARQAYIQKGGHPKHFLEYVNSANVAQELKDLHKNCEMVVTHLYEEFHVSIHSTFDELVIQDECVRPDIFIWMPKKPQLKLIVECDDFNHHSDRNVFSRDRARDRMLQEKGFQVLRFSEDEIHESPFETFHELRAFLFTKQTELFEEKK